MMSDEKKRALVIGGRGLVGSSLVAKLESQVGTCWEKFIWTSRARGTSEDEYHLDLLRPDAEWLLRRACPHVTFIVAAVTGVVRCEEDPQTWRVNADAPIQIAFQAAVENSYTIFVSSDAVIRAPRTAYAMQKARAEAFILGLGGCVVRPSRITSDVVGGFTNYLAQVGLDFCESPHRYAGRIFNYPEDQR